MMEMYFLIIFFTSRCPNFHPAEPIKPWCLWQMFWRFFIYRRKKRWITEHWSGLAVISSVEYDGLLLVFWYCSDGLLLVFWCLAAHCWAGIAYGLSLSQNIVIDHLIDLVPSLCCLSPVLMLFQSSQHIFSNWQFLFHPRVHVTNILSG